MIVYEKNIPITRHKIPTTVYILFLNLIKLQHLNLINRTMIVIKAKLYHNLYGRALNSTFKAITNIKHQRKYYI